MPVPQQDPIVVAPMPTPFRDDDSVDYKAIERNVQRWLATPLSGFVLNSENGEEAFLSEAERLAVVRTVNGARDGHKLIIGGVDSPSITETLRIAETLADAGAELIRVRIPRLTSNVQGYFEQVIPRAARPVVIIHQMAPGEFLSRGTRIGASPELLGEIMMIDNAFGYIMSDNLRFEFRVMTRIPFGKRLWACNGSLLLAAAAMGANGACMMLGNVLPRACHKILKLAQEGSLTQATELQTRVLEADWQILSRGAAGIKAALIAMGFEMGPPRSPSLACGADVAEQIQDALRIAGADLE